MKNDLISRQAAIDALDGLTDIFLNNLPPTIYKEDAIKAVKALPSAQPSVSKMEIVEDCISRAAVLNLIEQSCCDLEYDCDNVALRKEVEALPSAQPSVSKEEMVGDTISRQAAIKAICEDGTMLERQGKYTMTMAERKQKDADILDSLPSAQPGWTYIEEELPETIINKHTHDFQEYNCLCDFGDNGFDVRTYKFGNGHFWNGGGIVDKYVTAWQPLPEIPNALKQKPWEGGHDGAM